MNISYLEWNIHAAGDKNYTIPEWIPEYIKVKNVDIIVLTEFRCGYNWNYFRNALIDKYDIYISPYSSGISNQVCIALRRESKFYVKSVYTEDVNNCNIPELLQLDIVIDKKEKDQKELSIIGVRIKTQGGKDCKKQQIEYLKNKITSLNSCLCMGDFNCTSVNLQKLISNPDLRVFGPRIRNGYHSFVHKNEFRIGLDWIICKNLISVSNPYEDSKESPCATYDWGFLNDKNGYGEKSKDDYLNIKGLPDHAILLGQIEI